MTRTEDAKVQDRLTWEDARHMGVDPLPADVEPDADDSDWD